MTVEKLARIVLSEGDVRVCGDPFLLDVWCDFAEIFILSCGSCGFTKPSGFGI